MHSGRQHSVAPLVGSALNLPIGVALLLQSPLGQLTQRQPVGMAGWEFGVPAYDTEESMEVSAVPHVAASVILV